MRPEQATHLGDHRFDDHLDDYSPAAPQKQRELSARYLTALAQIKLADLSAVNQVDYRILKDVATTYFASTCCASSNGIRCTTMSPRRSMVC